MGSIYLWPSRTIILFRKFTGCMLQTQQWDTCTRVCLYINSLLIIFLSRVVYKALPPSLLGLSYVYDFQKVLIKAEYNPDTVPILCFWLLPHGIPRRTFTFKTILGFPSIALLQRKRWTNVTIITLDKQFMVIFFGLIAISSWSCGLGQITENVSPVNFLIAGKNF